MALLPAAPKAQTAKQALAERPCFLHGRFSPLYPLYQKME